MSLRHTLFFAAVCSSFIAHGAVALADEQAAPGAGTGASAIRLPVPYVERGITNPANILSPEFDLGISHVCYFLCADNGLTIGTLAVGAGYSFVDDFGFRATAFVLQFNQPFQLASAAMGATYRFARGNFEAGVALDWLYQAPANGAGSAGMVVLPSVPLHIHLGRSARLDITPTMPISTAGIYVAPVAAEGGGKTTVGLYVPVQLNVQIIDQIHLGLMTGLDMTFNPDSSIPLYQFGDTFFVPLGFQFGVTVPGAHGPILDMTAFFEWPELLVPAVHLEGASAAQGGSWLTGVNFTTFLYL